MKPKSLTENYPGFIVDYFIVLGCAILFSTTYPTVLHPINVAILIALCPVLIVWLTAIIKMRTNNKVLNAFLTLLVFFGVVSFVAGINYIAHQINKEPVDQGILLIGEFQYEQEGSRYALTGIARNGSFSKGLYITVPQDDIYFKDVSEGTREFNTMYFTSKGSYCSDYYCSPTVKVYISNQ